jgi:hypothetical protein
MSRLYIFEIASALIAVLLLVADCRHMLMEPPNAPDWAAMQRTPDITYLSSAQAERIQRADVIDQLNGLSMLVSASAAHPQLIAQ